MVALSIKDASSDIINGMLANKHCHIVNNLLTSVILYVSLGVTFSVTSVVYCQTAV